MLRQGLTLASRMAAGVAVVAALATPADAPAATCDLFGSVMEVLLTAQDDAAVLEVVGSELQVNRVNGDNVCAATSPEPLTTNTNVINVNNNPGFSGNRVAIQGAGAFAPGATALGENGGTPEIEIGVNLNNAPGARLDVFTAPAGGATIFGSNGINPNATAGESVPDADIIPSNIPVASWRNLGGNGPDVLGAQGGAGTGSALTVGIQLDGGGGDDIVVGGEGGDQIIGDWGNDNLFGGGGPDAIAPDGSAPLTTDDDTVDGGASTDTVSYDAATAGVTVDLALAGPQNTAGGGIDSLASVENLGGGPFGDTLRGDGGPNTLVGSDGGDDLDGRGAGDTLAGGPGNDTLDLVDGVPDMADCGDGVDTALVDGAGVDAVTACENVITPQPAGPGPGPGPAGQPANDFAFGKLKKNKRKGNAKLTVEVPGPGAVQLAGKGVKSRTAAATDAGDVKLKVEAKGAKARKLRRAGRAKVEPAVTFTPTGGSPNTQLKKVVLVRRG